MLGGASTTACLEWKGPGEWELKKIQGTRTHMVWDRVSPISFWLCGQFEHMKHM